MSVDPRLVLSEPELDSALEALLLAEAAIWTATDGALADQSDGPRALGRGHWRATFLIRRRPGAGVKELAALTGLSKQGASRILKDLEAAGLVETSRAEDARRRPATLTEAGRRFEAKAGGRLREELARAYRLAGVEAAPGARRVWDALSGVRPRRALPGDGR